MKYPVVSLFSGAMGLDLGLESAGLNIAVSQDIDPWCYETMRVNGKSGILGDIRTLLFEDPKADFLLNAANIKKEDIFAVVGGPPCQAFSTAGKRRGTEDLRGSLFNEFVQVVAELRPRFFVMENVKGLTSMSANPDDPNSLPLLNVILQRFQNLGYGVVYGMVDAVNYGTPQFRERLIVIGTRDHEDVFLPIPTHHQRHQDPNQRWKTLKDAVYGMKDIGACMKFTPNILKYLELVPEGGNWKSLPVDIQPDAMGGAFLSGGGKVGFYRRLNWNEPSPTLVTSPIQKATILGHPSELRPLSVGEYSRIQGFPEDWKIEGDMADCYRQIGNAVPIQLGKAIGQMLIAVAESTSYVFSKRVRGTSVHKPVNHESQQNFIFEEKKVYHSK
jgi:DNA (cytosine-5)-methyltransferase 1